MRAAMVPDLPSRIGVPIDAVNYSSPRADVPALTGLRFIAAFSVLIAHGVSWTLQGHETFRGVIYWIIQLSGFGMTLFFVLSGFVIHYNYAHLVTDGRFRGIGVFLWARFARLYPLFVLMMLIYVLAGSRTHDLLTGHAERFGSTLRAIPYFLFSVQSWFYVLIDDNPLLSAIGGGSPITWSISTEWFFYFSYPCIAWLILRARTPRFALLAVLAWCFLWSAAVIALFDQRVAINAWSIARFGPMADSDDHLQESFVRWLFYYSPYLRIGEFILGALVCQLYRLLQKRPINPRENVTGGAIFLVAALSVVPIMYLSYGADSPNIFSKMNMNFALAPSAALLIFCGARYDNAVIRLLTSTPAILLGEASYSIYLVHEFVLASAVKLTGSAQHTLGYDLVKLVLLFAIVLLISLGLYAYYEAPARKWLRRRWSRQIPEARRPSAF
jgi:peptidoglycan/LPS O-acetylase OafA/YrhL